MVIKTHPLMLFAFFKPYSFVLVFPFLRLFLKFGFKIILSGAFLFETAVFLAVLIVALLKWRCYRFYKQSDGFLVSSGVFLKRETYIPFERIASVYERQNLIEKLFSAKSIYISTEAKGKTADVRVCLKESVVYEVIGDKNLQIPHKTKRYNFKRVVLWAATSGGAFSGVVIFLPIISKTAELLEIGVYELLITRIAANTEILGEFMPKAANIATFVLLGFYIAAFVYKIFKGFGFSVKTFEKSIEISGGTIVKHRTLFKKTTIRGIVLEQPLLMRLLGLFTAKASVGGCEDEKLVGNSIIVPICSKKRAKQLFFENFQNIKPASVSKKVSARGGIVSAAIPAVTLMAAMFLLAGSLFYLLRNFRRLIVFLTIIAFLWALWWADLLIYNYKKGALVLEQKIVASGTVGLKRRTIYSDFDNVGFVKLVETPFDRRRGSCKATIKLFSKSADRVKVKWLKTDELLNLLSKMHNREQK